MTPSTLYPGNSGTIIYQGHAGFIVSTAITLRRWLQGLNIGYLEGQGSLLSRLILAIGHMSHSQNSLKGFV